MQDCKTIRKQFIVKGGTADEESTLSERAHLFLQDSAVTLRECDLMVWESQMDRISTLDERN